MMNTGTINISIEGNVGAGKSSLIAELHKKFHIKVINEPLDEYMKFTKDKTGEEHNPLKCMYEKPVENTLAAQLHIMDVCAQTFKQKMWEHSFPRGEAFDTGDYPPQILITDRSIYSCPSFIVAATAMKNITSFGQDFLLKDYENKLKNTPRLLCPHVMVYLTTAPKICARNVAMRGREFEKSLSFAHHTILDILLSEDRKERQKQYNRDQTRPMILSLDVEESDSTIDVVKKFEKLMKEIKIYLVPRFNLAEGKGE